MKIRHSLKSVKTRHKDSRIVRQARYTDWHRVERALSAMRAQIGQLEREGWRTR